MNRFFRGVIFSGLFFLSACASTIDGRNDSILETPEEVEKSETDYMTYLRLKKAPGPMDSDYILLAGRLARQMVRDPLFADKTERARIALRDVLNYHSSAQIKLPVVHEYVEHSLMNTRDIWIVDGSTPYEYVLDVELGEVEIDDDPTADKKGISVMFVLWNDEGDLVKEWFGFMKRSKGQRSWY